MRKGIIFRYMVKVLDCTPTALQEAAITLTEGNLVVFPTETVYGLGGDATSNSAVARIYKVKKRPKDHPLIVHISSMSLLGEWASHVPGYAEELAHAFWPGPLTMILPRTKLAENFITGGQENVALRSPENLNARILLSNFEKLGGYGVVAPSANKFGKVSATTVDAVLQFIGDALEDKDLVLNGGQSSIGIESTILDCTGNLPILVRPGFVSHEMVENVLGLKIESRAIKMAPKELKFSGKFPSHYAPNAKVFLNANPKFGDGFLAVESTKTPTGAIRLSSPKTSEELAHDLYSALHKADLLGLQNVHVHVPENGNLIDALKDRLEKAQFKNSSL